MPIVFDEVQGTVTSGAPPDGTQGPREGPTPTPPPPDSAWLTRNIRLLAQRKARLIAD